MVGQDQAAKEVAQKINETHSASLGEFEMAKEARKIADLELAELKEIIDLCHLYLVNVNIAFNILIFEDEIENAIKYAISTDFKNSIKNCENPYLSNTSASEIIVNVLKNINLGQDLLMKEFVDSD